MFEDLLKYIVEKKIYTELKGITSPGTEKILFSLETVENGYIQGSAIFSSKMVSSILFHQNGCTIVLKS